MLLYRSLWSRDVSNGGQIKFIKKPQQCSIFTEILFSARFQKLTESIYLIAIDLVGWYNLNIILILCVENGKCLLIFYCIIHLFGTWHSFIYSSLDDIHWSVCISMFMCCVHIRCTPYTHLVFLNMTKVKMQVTVWKLKVDKVSSIMWIIAIR